MDVLIRIKRAVIAGRVVFTQKAVEERTADSLTEQDVRESIVNAAAIYKSIRSTSPQRTRSRELLHIIYGTTYTGTIVYTKGKLLVERGIETYYVLISAKRPD